MLSLYSVFQTHFYLPSHLLSDLSLSLRRRCLLQLQKPLPSPTFRQACSYPWSVSFSSLAVQRVTQTRINPDPGQTTSFVILSPGFVTNPCLGTCQVRGTEHSTIPITAHFWRVMPRNRDPTSTGRVSHPPLASPSLRVLSGRAAQHYSSLLSHRKKTRSGRHEKGKMENTARTTPRGKAATLSPLRAVSQQEEAASAAGLATATFHPRDVIRLSPEEHALQAPPQWKLKARALIP